jgi:DNA polymerase-4
MPLVDDLMVADLHRADFGYPIAGRPTACRLDVDSRSRTLVGLIGSRGELESTTSDLIKAIFPAKKAVRLLGVSISGFVDTQKSPAQVSLF